MEIHAAVLRAESRFHLEQVNIDEPRDNEVLIRIVAVGMCHTDLSVVYGDLPLPRPIVLGHEGAGIVERVGSNVRHVAQGDHVVLSYPTCGKCRQCVSGHPNFCEEIMGLSLSGARLDGETPLQGTNAYDGEKICGCYFGQSSFASHALAYASNTVKISRDVPLELMGPFGCGLQTGAGAVLNTLKAEPGSSIAVFGCGAVGLASVMAANVAGCKRIVAVDRIASRLDLALQLGATHIVNIERDDPVKAIQELGGADYTLEASGSARAVEAAISAVRPFGGICGVMGVGAPNAMLQIPQIDICLARTVVGIVQGDANPQTFIPRLVELYRQGRFPVEKLVKIYAFNDINQAMADSQAGVTVKPILRLPH